MFKLRSALEFSSFLGDTERVPEVKGIPVFIGFHSLCQLSEIACRAASRVADSLGSVSDSHGSRMPKSKSTELLLAPR